jgi:Ca2+-binding EF-hand superfamily protein
MIDLNELVDVFY